MRIYRDDITFLRALAIISVVIFHIFPNFIKGGYLGVDIFFVISGFLITYILINDKYIDNTFNLYRFYIKRFVRIYPALIVFLFFTSILAFILVDFTLLKSYAESGLSSILGAGNIYMYYFLDTSYFAPDVRRNLLLHLWSLGVEWQFYIFLPLLFLINFKNYKASFLIVIVFFIVSMLLAAHISKNDAMFAYYMIPTRAFELLLGSIVAYIVMFYDDKLKIFHNTVICNITVILSLIIIIIGLFTLDSTYNLPNFYTLIVLVPTAILILLGSQSKPSFYKILENKVLLNIGLWSFSIYLYHWVFVSFYNNFIDNNINILHGIFIMILSTILGAVSYYLVEKPARRRLSHDFPTVKVIFVLPVFLFAFAYGFANYLKKSYPEPQEAYGSSIGSCIFENKGCFYNLLFNEDRNKVIFWGDSNAMHFFKPVEAIASKLEFEFDNLQQHTCAVFFNDHDYGTDSINEICDEFINSSFEILKEYKTVIISSQWFLWEEGLEDNLSDMLLRLNKEGVENIVLIANIPTVKRLYSRKVSRELFDNSLYKHEGVNSILEKIANEHEFVYYFDGFNDFLYSNSNKTRVNESLYFDEDHISIAAGIYIGNRYTSKEIDNIWYKIKDEAQ